MAAITNPTNRTYLPRSIQATLVSKPRTTLFSRFMAWCERQEQYHFGWVAGILVAHGCAITPITLFAIVLAGSNIALWIAAIVAMGTALVCNLAAQPTKVTVPVFFASILVDVTIIIACLVHGFNIAGTYI
ncbi:hypothetical protein [Flaviaesturariibacter terrae]